MLAMWVTDVMKMLLPLSPVLFCVGVIFVLTYFAEWKKNSIFAVGNILTSFWLG